MKVGFIGDVHGDIVALNWALDTLSDADSILCLGDIVDGRHDVECIELLQSRQVTVLQGNHDWVAGREWFTPAWLLPHCSWLRTLERRYLTDDFLAYHSKHIERHDSVHWEYLVEDRDIHRALSETLRPVIFCGHTHQPALHSVVNEAVTHIDTRSLVSTPTQTLHPDARHVVNVGRPTMCVVLYHVPTRTCEWRFHPTPPLRIRPLQSAAVVVNAQVRSGGSFLAGSRSSCQEVRERL